MTVENINIFARGKCSAMNFRIIDVRERTCWSSNYSSPIASGLASLIWRVPPIFM